MGKVKMGKQMSQKPVDIPPTIVEVEKIVQVPVEVERIVEVEVEKIVNVSSDFQMPEMPDMEKVYGTITSECDVIRGEMSLVEKRTTSKVDTLGQSTAEELQKLLDAVVECDKVINAQGTAIIQMRVNDKENSDKIEKLEKRVKYLAIALVIGSILGMII